MSARSTPSGTPERGGGLTRRSLDLLNASFSQQDDIFADGGGRGDGDGRLTPVLDPIAPVVPELSGELLKRSDHLKRWNSRYFVLSGDHLRYYKKSSDRFTRGNLNMAGVFVRQTSPREIRVKGKPLFCFELGHPASKQRIRVGARTISSAQQWEKALRAASYGGGEGTGNDLQFARMGSMQSMSVIESEEGVSLHEEEVNSGEEEDEQEEDADDQEQGGEPELEEKEGNEKEQLEEMTENREKGIRERKYITPRGSPQGVQTQQSPSGTQGSATPKASPVATSQQQQHVARSPLTLPKSNPIVEAGLSTGIVVAAILIPLATMHVGRFVLPWWVGNDHAAMRDLVGNLMFMIGFQAVVIAVMLRRQRQH